MRGGRILFFQLFKERSRSVPLVTFPSHAHNLDECLATIVDGFTEIKKQLPAPAVAISFAFPGPADYPAGIIGDLGNLPAFRGGVALGPMLQSVFHLPVFINNDGDLFAVRRSHRRIPSICKRPAGRSAQPKAVPQSVWRNTRDRIWGRHSAQR